MGKPQEQTIRISNQLVRATHSFTLSEKRLLMLAVSKVTEGNINEPIHISTAEYSDTYNVDSRSAHRTMVQAESGLWGREFVLDGYIKRWVTDKRVRGSGDWDVAIRIHEDLKPHISELKACYTQYLLKRASDFKSVYTWRIFELIMQFRATGLLRIKLSEFSESVDYPESYKKDFGVVRQKVIAPALKAIKDAGLPVVMNAVKKGRSVHMLEFTFPTEQQLDIFNAPAKPVVNDAYITKHARPGESWDAARKRLTEELKKETPA